MTKKEATLPQVTGEDTDNPVGRQVKKTRTVRPHESSAVRGFRDTTLWSVRVNMSIPIRLGRQVVCPEELVM